MLRSGSPSVTALDKKRLTPSDDIRSETNPFGRKRVVLGVPVVGLGRCALDFLGDSKVLSRDVGIWQDYLCSWSLIPYWNECSWCRGTDSNRRRRALQARALPSELPRLEG